MSQVNRREIMANNELYYLETLEKAFYEMFHRIHFHPNPKYPVETDLFYIGFEDMSNYKYTIRACSFDAYNDSNDPIVASYSSMKELLLDGWRPD